MVDELGLSELLPLRRIHRAGRVISLLTHGQIREGIAGANQNAVLGDS